MAQHATPRENLLRALKSRYALLTGIIAVEFLLFGFLAPYFLTVGNLLNILRQISEIGMISIPLTFLLLSGHMDLSVGSIVGVCGIVCGMILRAGQPIALAVLAGIVAAPQWVYKRCDCGQAENSSRSGHHRHTGNVPGLMLYHDVRARCQRLPPILFCAGQRRCYGPSHLRSGACHMLHWRMVHTGANLFRPIYPGHWQQPEHHTLFRHPGGQGEDTVVHFLRCHDCDCLGIPHLAPFQRRGHAGLGYELDIITAALIGGIDINGGSGKLQGTFLGILIIGILRNGLNLMGLSVIYQSIILGVLLLAAVAKRKG